MPAIPSVVKAVAGKAPLNYPWYVNFIIKRLGEPSTYNAIAVALGFTGTRIGPGVMQDIVFAGTVLSAILGVFIKEGWRNALESGDAVATVEARLNILETTTGNERIPTLNSNT